MIGFSVYTVASGYQRLTKQVLIKNNVKCKYCRTRINTKVTFNVITLSGQVALTMVRLNDAWPAPVG